MRLVRQALPGLFIALVSIVIILGGSILSFAESSPPALIPTHTLTPTRSMTATYAAPSITPTRASPTSLSSTETFTPSPSVTPTECPQPPGWVSYLVKSGDTLESLAARYHTSVEMLLQNNCLAVEDFQAGNRIYVPPLPTRTAEFCGPPLGWVLYPVQHGDTLYHLSVQFGVTVHDLQMANCMGTSTLLVIGKWIYVPPWAPIYPTPTFIPYYPPEPTWTEFVPYTPTPTRTDTPTATPFS